MNPNTAMANMNPMGGAVAGAPMPMMNNAAANQQGGAAAAARQQQMNDNQRGVLNTYIYEYFIRYGMFDCARSLLSSDQQVNVLKDVAHRRNEGGNAVNGTGDDAMDTDTKDDADAKLPDDLPPPKLPMPASDTSFLYEWFCLFWDIYNAQRAKGGNGTVNQYVAHTQELFRQMRPEMAQQQYQAQMARMQNGGMGMAMKQGNLARAAMANNQSNPQMQMMAAQAKQNQMQRDPSQMDGNRGDRPNSPAAGENAPSPSSAKRPRLDSTAGFNGNQPGGMMPNGNAVQGMAGQQPMNSNANVASAHQMLVANGINPSTLTAQQLNTFINSPQSARQKSIATYSQNLQQHHGNQMGNNKMPNAAGPQNQGSPMVPQGPDGTSISAFYNPGEMGGPGGIRPGPAGTQATAGSNHALQDYQMQLMLLEQQNKKRLMMARQEQDNLGQQGTPGQTGPNGQPFPDGSPQAVRAGASPNPTDQAKRGTPQMNNSGIPSPVPEGGQSRDSPNPGMNFMNVDPNMGQHFFKNMDGTMGGAQAQMNGMRPPSSHPGQPFNNQQMMAAARQQQQQQGGPTTPQQWQQGPNGQMAPQSMQQNQQMQGTPQQRAMPPPSAPVAANSAGNNNNNNNRTTASPQQAAAAPPTPNQSTKAAPKKKETKAQKEKRAAAAKKNQQNNANNANNAEGSTDQETPTPATPMTPANAGANKGGANAGNAQANTGAATTTAATTTAPQAAPVPGQVQGDASQNGLENFNHLDFNSMDIANPLQSGDVLNDFDFDSFLHDGDGSNEPFDFNGAFSAIDGGEIGAE